MLIGKVTLGAMLDSGSMACTLSEAAEEKLIVAGAVDVKSQTEADVVLVGCGGRRVKPKTVLNVEMEVYGCKLRVPTLVVPGQLDELIVGTNVIKHILRQFKQNEGYWKAVSAPSSGENSESEKFLSLLAGLTRWKGDDPPDKVGTVRCNKAVTLIPGSE